MNKLKYTPIIIIVFFAILSYLTIAPYVAKKAIIAAGESPIYLNPTYFDYFSMWEDKLNFGTRSTFQSNIVLYSIIWQGLKAASPLIHPSVIFIFLSTFLASTTFYYVTRKIVKLNNEWLYVPPTILYTHNTFRLLGPLNERVNLLFILLPLFFFFYYRLLNKQNLKYVFALALVGFIASPIGANPPLFTIPYVLMFFYLIYFWLTNKDKKLRFKVLKLNILLLILTIGINLFWLVPSAITHIDLFVKSDGGLKLFSALGSGRYYDHFRFLGSWAWRGVHYQSGYYPFSTNYDLSFLLLTTFSIVVVTFYGQTQTIAKKRAKLLGFLYFLLVTSLFFLAGNKTPFDEINNLLYKVIPILSMYREPFTKFTPLFIFAAAFIFLTSLEVIDGKLKTNAKRIFFLLVVTALTIINAYPMFTVEAIPTKHWNAAQLGNLVKIPTYWKEVNNFLNTEGAKRVLLFPYSPYATSNNWEYGINLAGNVADFILDAQTLKGWAFDKSDAGQMLDNTTNGTFYLNNYNLQNYLSLFNVKYILQTNDMEWRYNEQINSPKQSKEILVKNELEKVKSFGRFDQKSLSKILNLEKDPHLFSELYIELVDNTALDLYELPKTKFIPQIFIPNQYIYADSDLAGLRYTVSIDSYKPGSGIFLVKHPNTNNTVTSEHILNNIDQIAHVPTPKKAELLVGELKWDEKLPWPEADTDPNSIKYKFVVLWQRIKEVVSKSNEDKSNYTVIWNLAKKTVEIDKYTLDQETQTKLFSEYKLGMTNIIESYKKVAVEDRNKEFWNEVKRTFLYFQKGLEVLKQRYAKHPETIAIDRLYREFKIWIDYEQNLECHGICYEFKATETGSYNIGIEKNSSDYLEKFTVFDTNTKQNVKINEPVESSKYFSSLGTAEFQKDATYKIDLQATALTNLLSEGEWLTYEGIVNKEEYTLEFIPQNFIPGYRYLFLDESDTFNPPKLILFNEYVQFKKINNWESYKNYKISFDYNIYGGGFGYSLVEEFPNYRYLYNTQNKGNSLQIIGPENVSNREKVDRVKTFFEFDTKSVRGTPDNCDNTGKCTFHYEKTIQASKDARNAHLFIYAFSEEKESSNILLENIRIEQVIEPQLVIHLDKMRPQRNLPNVTFVKNNPTHYTVEIKDAKDPFVLAFVESFDENWQLLFNAKQIAANKHYKINGFANSWVIEPQDTDNKNAYTLEIKYKTQNTLNLNLLLSAIIAVLSLLAVIYLKLKEKKHA